MADKVKLTEAQWEMLKTVPDKMTLWTRRRGMPFLILNRTADALERHGFIKTAFMPPRWSRTPAGRAHLSSGRND